MDEDALASTYVTKVLTCLSKWRVKMQGLIEVFSLEKEESENLTQNLCRNEYLSSLSKFCKGHTCSLSCPVVLTHHPTCGNAISPHQLRICKRCGEIDKELATISQGISDVNTKGIIGGFTSECLPWVPS